MTLEKFFVFLYPVESETKKFLDLAIYLLNPDEKWPAHVTVAGPFKDRRRFAIQKRDFSTTVFAMTKGNFFHFGSGTVFFHVGFPERDQVWSKPDYPGVPLPHLTLYDGKDMEFAKEVFDKVAAKAGNFSFDVQRLDVVGSISGQRRSDLRMAADLALLPETQFMQHRDVQELPADLRIRYASEALSKVPQRHKSFWSNFLNE